MLEACAELILPASSSGGGPLAVPETLASRIANCVADSGAAAGDCGALRW